MFDDELRMWWVDVGWMEKEKYDMTRGEGLSVVRSMKWDERILKPASFSSAKKEMLS